MNAKHLDVFYDANCEICTASMQWLRAIDKRNALQFRDINSTYALEEAQGRFSREDLASQMHLHMPNGSWRVGYFALIEIIRTVPGLAWVSPVMQFPPVAELGHALYKRFANHRYSISAACRAGACRVKGTKTWQQ